MIWRIIIVGWFKFARNKEQSLKLLSFILSMSKHHPKSEESKKADAQEEEKKEEDKSAVVPAKKEKRLTFYDMLLTTKRKLAPIQIFDLRFFSLPQSFFFLETLQMSNVKKYIFVLRSDQLFNANLIQGEEKKLEESKLLPPPVKLTSSNAYFSGDNSTDGNSNLLSKDSLS